ncbi:UDP-glucuronate 4-epimerase [Trichococcus flocculiformis]|uniref:SDR family NAD(P)-dependent oxidoreductase n=1 Tax=Trichococcus TaxID=82802 RepID=UPI0007A8231C|nr:MULTISPECIES: SDR family NAD(P)-dependent oxidoreductase [Trichococcus]CZR09081.1 nucleotide sugar epimerase [Trichococcus sp. ES5]SHG08091.1 UDP-glucuronate 4-epimerase [Trichococcus flocculiformis]
MQPKSILVTGAAGFVGYYLSERLLQEGHNVVGIDNLNDYYDVNLKHERLNKIKEHPAFTFAEMDLADKEAIHELFAANKFDIVVNLAAQAGVRYSIENPDAYIQSNIVGFHNILEACRHNPVEHLLYASSSSVYGSNKKVPFEETDFVDNPVSLYAATKKSNELMAHTYSHLYGIPATGLRFFTVYGPMGRPDMAYFGFTDKFFNNEPIHIFNNGDFENDLYRDFTYIDDIITGIIGLIEKPTSGHTVFNIGNNNPEKLMVFITSLEKALSNSLGREVEFEKIFEPIKPGDVPATYASTDKLQEAIGFKPETSIQDGLQRFTDWYVNYYHKK